MPLTDVAIRKAKAKAGEKPTNLSDERGLNLEIAPSRGKWLRRKYRFEGKEEGLSLEIHPDGGQKEAQERRDSARRLVADGVDPSENRKAPK